MESSEWACRRHAHFCAGDKGAVPLSHCKWSSLLVGLMGRPFVASLLMLGAPSGGGGAGVLLEGLGEGSLLRVA